MRGIEIQASRVCLQCHLVLAALHVDVHKSILIHMSKFGMRLVSFSSNFKLKTTSIGRGKDARAAGRHIRRIIHTFPLDGSDTTGLPSEPVNFEDLGLHPPIVAALRRAFPNLARPTEAQAKFIPAILNGKDILLKDSTGSGKCVIYLLTLTSATHKNSDHLVL